MNIATFRPGCYSWACILDSLKLAPHSLYILSTEIMIKKTLVFTLQACFKEAKRLSYSPFTSYCVLLRITFVSLEFFWDDFLYKPS